MSIIERRGILKGLAASAIAAPLAQLFRMHTGRAAGTGALPKVVFFYTPCGVELPLWHPTETGKTFTLPRLSAPLQPHAADCIFMDGISMVPLDDHQGGSQQMLAGDDKDVVTLDLQLSDFLTPQKNTPFSFVELGIQSRISKGGTPTVPHPHFTRRSLAHEIFAEDNPLAAFASLFGPGTPPASAAMSTAATMLLAKQQKSVLDTTTADLTALASKLPNSEKNKIASYTDAIRTLEMRLTSGGGGIGNNAAMCSDFSGFNPTKFTVPQVGDPNQASYQQTANQGVVADLQMEIARLSLACGRVQVVTLIYGHTNAHNPITGLGPFGVHDASHYNAPPGQLVGNATPAQIDAKLTAWRNYREWYAQRLAQFIVMLKSTPDVTGTLFDNTIILHCSELGDGGPHKTNRVPFVFIGGGALGFKLGQAINFTGGVPAYSGGAHSGQRYMSHSPLLTIVAKKMGMPLPGPFFGFSGPQALDPMSIGVI
ncbi:MAG: hypothetical protein QOI66_4039 [Myxococcales bacterium]|jgi:hypothetical protein|nr:hypothetical protein [Myxococcales bacterium]